jgi:hypothetical protein
MWFSAYPAVLASYTIYRQKAGNEWKKCQELSKKSLLVRRLFRNLSASFVYDGVAISENQTGTFSDT